MDMKGRQRYKDRPWYTVSEVARILHTSPMMVRVSLKQQAPGWDFPWILMDDPDKPKAQVRIRIPIKTFQKWYKGRFGEDAPVPDAS